MTPMLGSKLRRGSRCNPISMHLRTLASLLVALLTLGLVAGCGGGGDAADSSTDVQELLDDTFSGDKAIESGRLDLGVRLESDTGQPATVKVSGPFQSQGAGRLPLLDVDASLEGGGQSLKGGLTATEDQAFVSWDGTSYEIAGPVFQQFKAGYEEAAKQSEDQQNQSLASLGIDPRRWLTNAENEGERDVGGTETILITGDVDVPKLLEDVDGALEKVRSLGVQGSEDLPERLTDEEKRQTAEAIDNLSVEIYTGAEDRILRRMVVALGLKAPEGSTSDGAQSVDIRFDLQLLEVNEDQEIQAPENAESFDKLLEQLEGLGLSLGQLGGLGGSGSGSGGGGGTTQQNLEEYSKCIQEAAGDNAKVRKCADLLTTP
jgi:hypothetical protein